MMVQVDSRALSGLVDIVNKATEAERCEREAVAARKHLQECYNELRKGGRLHPDDSAEWAEMKAATQMDYDAAQKAKRDARNARRRLSTAVNRFNPDGLNRTP